MSIMKLSGENKVAIPPIEIDRLKRVFGGGRGWGKDETDGAALASMTTDGQLILTYSKEDGRLDISTAKVAIDAAAAASVEEPHVMKMDQALMNLGAAPEVDSVKPLKIEKNEAGEITMQSEQIKYKGGWIQIVSLSSKKNSQSRSVVTYDEKGHISGLEVSFLKENPALEVAEGRKILEACFETLTTKKYNPDEFRFVEIDDGRTMMVWANKHEGQAVYAYLEAYGLGCGTSRLSEAVEKGLIPK